MVDWRGSKIGKLKERYDRLIAKRKVSDYDLAKLMTSFRDALGDPSAFVPFCTDHGSGLGLGASTAHMYQRMIAALESIDSKGVWQAVGWEGVRKLVRVTQSGERLAVCRSVMREGDEGQLTPSRLDHILAARAPSYRPAKRRPTKKLKKVPKDEVARERDILKAELISLVAKWSQLQRDLSPKAKKILGFQ